LPTGSALQGEKLNWGKRGRSNQVLTLTQLELTFQVPNVDAEFHEN